MVTLEYYFVKKGALEHVIFNNYNAASQGNINKALSGTQNIAYGRTWKPWS
jgi:hypothetical protein